MNLKLTFTSLLKKASKEKLNFKLTKYQFTFVFLWLASHLQLHFRYKSSKDKMLSCFSQRYINILERAVSILLMKMIINFMARTRITIRKYILGQKVAKLKKINFKRVPLHLKI